MRVADYIVERLSEAGIQHVFAVSGRGSLFLTDAVARNASVDYVGMHHEQSAGFAAVAYAQYNSLLGACIVSTGCASTNAITAVLSAWQDGVPAIFISGQNTLRETTHFTNLPIRTYGQQEADITKLVKPITKYSIMVTDPGDIGRIMDEAIFEATSGRKGPVWIDVPLDIQSMRVEPNILQRKKIEIASYSDSTVNDAIEVIVSALRDAERPVCLIGSGVQSSGSTGAFAAFIEANPIPVTFSGSAVDTYGTANAWSIGSVGMMGCSRAGNFAVQNADLILVFGNRLSSMTTGTEFLTFAREAKIIAIDIDPNEHSKNPIKIDCVIDVDIKILLDHLSKLEIPKTREAWLDKCLHWKELFAPVEPDFCRSEKVDLYQLARALSKTLPKKSSLITDSGFIELILPTNIAFGEDTRCIHPASQGSMGYALPAAVGVQFSSTQPVIVVVGDGSIMMNLQELQTIKHHNLPIKILVVNNDVYSIIRKRQEELFRGRTIGTDPSNGVSCPSFKDIAQTFSLKYCQIIDSLDLEVKLRAVLEEPGSVLCEITGFTDQEYIQTSQILGKNRRLIRKPLEDQAPFIERNLFFKEMVIPPMNEGN